MHDIGSFKIDDRIAICVCRVGMQYFQGLVVPVEGKAVCKGLDMNSTLQQIVADK
jgi:hypothetical protein